MRLIYTQQSMPLGIYDPNEWWSKSDLWTELLHKGVPLIQRKKIFFVNYKGGRCIRCGYRGYAHAFDFHHIDPSTKEVGWGHMRNWEMNRIRDELSKCVLLCSRCHREVHAKVWIETTSPRSSVWIEHLTSNQFVTGSNPVEGVG